MNAIQGFLGYLFAAFDVATLQGRGHALAEQFSSANPLFWILIVVLCRFVVPDVVLWLFYLFYPRALVPPPGAAIPNSLVSVVIAGRDVGPGIVNTVQTILDCGYPKIEVIYVDDFSSDDTVACVRTLESTGKVRVFETHAHNGKPSSLNIGISMARGEFIFIMDADCELQAGPGPGGEYANSQFPYGVMQRLLAPFADPEVGAVGANLRVRNATCNMLTGLQECEYALNISMSRMWRASVGLLSILAGAGSIFRADILRALGGYDTGNGEDGDITVRVRKLGWKLSFALDAVVWTDVPENYPHLLRQRSRWTRNMAKLRLHKHSDLVLVWRYGILNALVFIDIVLFRVALPFFAAGFVIYYALTDPFAAPAVLTVMYWLTIYFLLIKLLIANDMAATPRLSMLWLIPLYPFYRLPVRWVELLAITRELLHVAKWHPYVPKRIWAKIPHW